MVNAVNKLQFPTTGARGKGTVRLSYRIEFYLFVFILVILAIGLWLTVLVTNEWTGNRLKDALDRYMLAEKEEEENCQK